MSVKIGHASIDENGKAKNGNAGDQTKKEVYTRTWYNKPWTSVIRPKDSSAAEKIAKTMEQACANDKIGYDQYQRTTLYTQAKSNNWDLSKITTACECDCSSLVAVCVNAAGISVSKDIYTGNQLSALKATGKFDVYTDSKYIGGDSYLKRGDILLGQGHTAIVLSNGANAVSQTSSSASVQTTTSNTSNVVVDVKKNATEAAKSFDKSMSGTYKVTASALNVRSGAGVNKKIMVTIPKDTAVKNYGYYTTVLGTNWLYVQFTYKNVTYTGFASSKYLKKV